MSMLCTKRIWYLKDQKNPTYIKKTARKLSCSLEKGNGGLTLVQLKGKVGFPCFCQVGATAEIPSRLYLFEIKTINLYSVGYCVSRQCEVGGGKLGFDVDHLLYLPVIEYGLDVTQPTCHPIVTNFTVLHPDGLGPIWIVGIQTLFDCF